MFVLISNFIYKEKIKIKKQIQVNERRHFIKTGFFMHTVIWLDEKKNRKKNLK